MEAVATVAAMAWAEAAVAWATVVAANKASASEGAARARCASEVRCRSLMLALPASAPVSR